MNNKVKCPRYGETNRPHNITVIGDLLFECSCGEVFQLGKEDITKIYNTIAKSQDKRIYYQVKGDDLNGSYWY